MRKAAVQFICVDAHGSLDGEVYAPAKKSTKPSRDTAAIVEAATTFNSEIPVAPCTPQPGTKKQVEDALRGQGTPECAVLHLAIRTTHKAGLLVYDDADKTKVVNLSVSDIVNQMKLRKDCLEFIFVNTSNSCAIAERLVQEGIVLCALGAPDKLPHAGYPVMNTFTKYFYMALMGGATAAQSLEAASKKTIEYLENKNLNPVEEYVYEWLSTSGGESMYKIYGDGDILPWNPRKIEGVCPSTESLSFLSVPVRDYISYYENKSLEAVVLYSEV